MKALPIPAALLGLTSLALPACDRIHADATAHHDGEHNHIVITSPAITDVVITQPYVCRICSQKHIEVRALEEGYLEEIPLKEGQAVREGQVLFTVIPALYQARLDAERAEVSRAELKLQKTRELFAQKIESETAVLLDQAELAKAKALAAQAEVELRFTKVVAQFDGIIDRLYQQKGSLVKKEDLLTTLSDNSVMWVYFNVPEVRYLEYKARQGKRTDGSRLDLVDSRIELVLADGTRFGQDPGNTVTVEGEFNFETGNIPFRADFPNPDRLLRHGQTGTIRLHRKVRDALVIPQRATFEILDKQYVWVVGADQVAHQRLITIAHELEDTFVISGGLDVNDKFILDGVRQVKEGDKVEEAEFEQPAAALAHQKFHAE